MTGNGSVQDNRAGNSAGETNEEVPEIRTLTQIAVNEQIKRLIVPLSRKIEERNRLVQGMVTTPHLSHCCKTDYSTVSVKAPHHLDLSTGTTLTRNS